MTEELKDKVKAEFQKIVTPLVAAGAHTRWGNAESVKAIEGLVDFLANDEDAAAEGFDSIRAFVEGVVNPSAFAQKLEALPTTNPRHLRRPGKGERKSSDALGL